ncbi:MFS transporter [Lapillicoccus sp.]|uniref:MFS transporter n=1 Tax=Lapillicoccus sp. TaxID=1909287 RepID=UPI003266CB03
MAGVELSSPVGRGIVAAAVLGSGMAMLDGTVVNIALVRIGQDLDATLAELQWVTNGYLLSLASLILLGGSLGDRLGRRRVFVWGVVGFAVTSALCGIAQNPTQLVVGRILQGVAGALLTPGSLSMIEASLRSQDRAKAIGSWTGLGGIASAIGPFVGGWLVQYASWRWVFFLNIPLAALTVVLALRFVPESRDEQAGDGFDVVGAALAIGALAFTTFALIQYATLGAGATIAIVFVGVAFGAGFVVVERRAHTPMVQPSLFASRQFSAANAMTLVVYGALGAVLFFLSLQLQVVVGYGPLLAGVATLPITALMLLLAARGGELGARIGPRLPMALGPAVCGIGVALLAFVGPDSAYLTGILPGLTIFGLGLCLLVAPLTATVLAAAPDRYVGAASGVNNAVARSGTLLAVAALPALVGLGGDAYRDPELLSAAYRSAMWLSAGLLVVGAVVSWSLIRNTPQNAPLSDSETDS